MATVPGQFADQEAFLAGHDLLAGGGVANVMHAKAVDLRIGPDGPPLGMAFPITEIRSGAAALSLSPEVVSIGGDERWPMQWIECGPPRSVTTR